MKKNRVKISFTIMIIWVAVIFSFSLQSARDSSRVSLGVGYCLMKLLPAEISKKILLLRPSQLSFLHTLLRKMGHFSEYFVLGALSRITFSQTEFRYRNLLMIGFCVLIASVDETIQLFVDGRSGQVSDVALDSVGALCGIALVMVVMRLLGNRKSKV